MGGNISNPGKSALQGKEVEKIEQFRGHKPHFLTKEENSAALPLY
jgi:hypothetical protein